MHLGFVRRLSRNRDHHAREMQVEERPKRHQLAPRSLAVALSAHPRVLVVRGADQLVRELRPDEALMIVGCGIDQVADDFLARPFAWRARKRRVGIGDGLELRYRDGKGTSQTDSGSFMFQGAPHRSCRLANALDGFRCT